MDPEEMRERNQVKGLVVIILFFIGLVAAFFAIFMFSSNMKTPHIDIEIVKYRNHSFDNHTSNWGTTVNMPDGRTFELIQRHPPWKLEDIEIRGDLFKFFRNISGAYVTFDPDEEVHSEFTTMAFAELIVLSGHYGFGLVGAYTKENNDRSGADIITCDSDTSVIFLNQLEIDPIVVIDDNCIIISGKDEDLVRATNRLLYQIYGIM